MNKINYVKAVQGLLQDEFDPDEIVQAGNWYQNELAMRNHLRIFEASDTVTASTGDTTADFPSDMLTMISLYMTVPQVLEFKTAYVEYGDFMKRYANFATATPAQAFHWTDWANGMRFSQPLNADHTFQVDYIRTPVPVEDDEDEFEIPALYEEMMVRGGLVRIMEINEDYDEADRERVNHLDKLERAFLKNEVRGQIKSGPVIIRKKRGPNRERIWEN